MFKISNHSIFSKHSRLFKHEKKKNPNPMGEIQWNHRSTRCFECSHTALWWEKHFSSGIRSFHNNSTENGLHNATWIHKHDNAQIIYKQCTFDTQVKIYIFGFRLYLQMVYEHYLRSMQPPSVLIIEYTYGIYGQTFSKTTPVIANKYSFPFHMNANTHTQT